MGDDDGRRESRGEGRPGTVAANPLGGDAERLSSREVFSGKIVHVSVDEVRLPGGRVSDQELVHVRGAAAVLPVLPDGRLLLLSHFRYPTGGWVLEIPAGKVERGEGPEAAARRELEEETGRRLAEDGRLVPLGWLWTSPGFCDEKIWLFAAVGLEETPRAEDVLDDDEVLELVPLPAADALDRARRGEIHDAKTACAVLRWGARAEI